MRIKMIYIAEDETSSKIWRIMRAIREHKDFCSGFIELSLGYMQDKTNLSPEDIVKITGYIEQKGLIESDIKTRTGVFFPGGLTKYREDEEAIFKGGEPSTPPGCKPPPHEMCITIIRKPFKEEWGKLNNIFGNTSLAKVKISYHDNIPAISIDDLYIDIPDLGHEHHFCRAMFIENSKAEPKEWVEVYQIIYGDDEWDGKKRNVRDTMYAVNERIRSKARTKDSLFNWENNRIKCLFPVSTIDS